MKGHPQFLILTFSSPIPDRVKIAAMSYQVKQSIPSPFRCKNAGNLVIPPPDVTLVPSAVKNVGNPILQT
jgi:hypothetical protein